MRGSEFLRVLLGLGAVALFCAGSLSSQDVAVVQKRLDTMTFQEVTPDWLTLALGTDYKVTVGKTVIEGYRGDKLEALCTQASLSAGPTDRTLRLAESRTEHVYSYPSLGLSIVFLDNPWVVWKIRLVKSDLALRELVPGTPWPASAAAVSGLPRLTSRLDKSTCFREWDHLQVFTDCSTFPDHAEVIREVVVLNPALPSGCWLRGMFE